MIAARVGDVHNTSGLAAYEELRSGVLAGSRIGGHFGQVLLMREGVAAWLAQGSTRAATFWQGEEATVDRAHPQLVSDEINADVVRLLATMALALAPLASREEMST